MSLFNPQLIGGVYKVTEYAFNSTKILKKMKKRVTEKKIKTFLSANIFKIKKNSINQFEIFFNENGNDNKITSHQVINCTYANLNEINSLCNASPLPLKHELTEICLIKPPKILKDIGITIMDGAFFSMMPFPSKQSLHSFTHVRYTPHLEWTDRESNGADFNNQILRSYHKKTHFKKMIYDAVRFLPIIKESHYKESMWTIKVVLLKSENNDSRPILFKENYEKKGYHCVMGGKIDNVYDAITALNEKVLQNE